MKGKCLTLILAVVCVLALHSGCQNEPRQAEEIKTAPTPTHLAPRTEKPPEQARTIQPEPDKPGPKISFENVVCDLGEIGPGTKNACEFKFKNSGDTLLKIKEVSKTCGCTPFRLEKNDYEPGESGTITVTYQANRSPGGVAKHLYVSSNDKTKPKVGLTLKGKVVLKVRHEPQKLSLLLNNENTGCPEITLTSVDGQPFAVKSFKSTGNCITTSFNSSVKDTKFVLTPKIDTEQLKRSLNGYIRIGLTHPQCDMVTVQYSVLPRFSVTPSSIVVRNADPQKSTKKVVWVLNNYGEDFEIESTSSSKDIIKLLSQEKVDDRYKFELEITPPDTKDRRSFTDVFYMNVAEGEKLSVNCRGYYSSVKRLSKR